ILSQRKYVLDLLEETGMKGCRPVDTPMDTNVKLCATNEEDIDIGKYQRLVGKLIYLTVTRPDISYAVSVVSQFMHKPQITHWQSLERILRYLKGAPGRGLLYKKHGHFNIEGFSDADWAGSPDDRKSTSGYCTLVGGNLVTWKSKKQNVVARSSAEAEYRAMAHTVSEILWIRTLLTELGFYKKGSMNLHCDNQAAIHITSNPVFHERTKHIEVDCHFIR
ncbi:secreted RxLR effector protein 161-like, partial [Aristolochia californica]|uniref:secreted RxLR effector protein 161-like n=1 Tax=Aristolochia californica TaxID=171875 RepID=UPI0035E2B0C2